MTDSEAVVAKYQTKMNVNTGHVTFLHTVPTVSEVSTVLAFQDIKEMVSIARILMNATTLQWQPDAWQTLSVAIYRHISYANVYQDMKEMEKFNVSISTNAAILTLVVLTLYVKILPEITLASVLKVFTAILLQDVMIWTNVNTHTLVDQVPYVKTLSEEENVIVHQVMKATLIRLVVGILTNVLDRTHAEETLFAQI